MGTTGRTIILLAAGFLCLHAADWLTFGGNPQRTGWARKEKTLNTGNAKSLSLLWKLKLDNEPREMDSLTTPVVIEGVITNRGFKDIVIVAGSSDNLYAIDADTGTILWKKTFEAQSKPRQRPHWLCPNALNDTPVIEKGRAKSVYVISSDGQLHMLNVVNGEDREPPFQFVPPFSKNWSLNFVDGILYTTTSQGCNGAKSGVYAVNLKDPKHPVSFFQADVAGAGIWGRAGAAVDSSGNVFVETGDGPYDAEAGKFSDSFLKLSPDGRKLLDYYTPVNRAWITRKDLDMGCISPVVFPYKQWELIAGGGKEGVLYLLDAKSPGGADHRTPFFRSPLYTNEDVDFAGRGFWGALATWEDPQGIRWLYAPAWGPIHSKAPAFPITNGPAPNGSIMAFKVEVKDGKPVLTPAWMSRDMNLPAPPIVTNGLVLALSDGDNGRQADNDGRIMDSKQRIAGRPGNSVLYVFDAATGKQLYSSGDTIKSFSHFSGLALSLGRVLVTTYDSTVYEFGLNQR